MPRALQLAGEFMRRDMATAEVARKRLQLIGIGAGMAMAPSRSLPHLMLAQAAAATSLLARYRQKVDEQRGQPLRGGSVGGGTIQM